MGYFHSFAQPTYLDTIVIAMQNRPYFPVHINGQGPYWLLFDTGAVGSNVSQEVARTLGLPTVDERTLLETLTLGQTQWTQVIFGIRDTTPEQHLLGRPLDGYLGNTFLLALLPAQVLTINYPVQTVILGNVAVSRDRCAAAGVGPDARITTVPLQITQYYVVVPVWLNGQGPYQFFLDTGASHCRVSLPVAQALGLLRGEEAAAHGLANVETGYWTTVSHVSVGAAERCDLPMLVMDCGLVSGYVGSQIDGYLGHTFLESFSVVFDYQQAQLTFFIE